MNKTTMNTLLILFISFLLSLKENNDFLSSTPQVGNVADTNAKQYGTPFAKVPDPRDAIVYQVNIRAFSQGGNFAGVIARLDSIKALGANVVYLMPIFPVGAIKSVNSPYCVKDYNAINSEFGTLNDLRKLVNGAHARNMSVILDWVGNHTSWDNGWITAHKNWYLQDSSGNVVSPPKTGWNDVAQLNFSNPAMRLAMISAMKYWVYTANVDGFRCDYADGPPVDFWKQAIDSLRAITTHHLLLLAEGSRSANFTAGFDYNFGFAFFGNLKAIYKRNRPVTSIDSLNLRDYRGTTDKQQIVRYTTNHDVNGSDGTPQELFGGMNGSLAAFSVAALMKGVPMIYNGQEVGTPYRITFPFTSTKIDWSINPDITMIYKKIIAFRKSSPAVRRGTLTSYSTADVCAFTKMQGKEQAFVITNMRNAAIPFSVPASLSGTTWHNVIDGSRVVLSGELTLQPYSYLILKNH
jgi:glycosidase